MVAATAAQLPPSALRPVSSTHVAIKSPEELGWAAPQPQPQPHAQPQPQPQLSTSPPQGDEAWEVVPDPRYDRYGFRRPEDLAQRQAEFEVDYAARIGQQERRWLRRAWTAEEVRERPRELKRLARQGIPPARRGEIWQQMAGTDTLRRKHAKGYFEALVRRDAETEGEPSATVRQIELDLARTFPGHRLFSTDRGREQLRQVLVAYALRNPRVGYVQGMGFIAALLLVFMPTEPAFWCFVAFVERLLPRDFFGDGLLGLIAEQRTLEELVGSKLPRLAKHLRRHGVQSEHYATRWFVCVFANTLPVETTLRVWDVFFCEGCKVLHRVGIALLKVAEPTLLACDTQQELLCTLQREQARCLDCERLISFAFDISFIGSFPRQRVDALRQRHRAEVLAECGGVEPDSPSARSDEGGDGGGGGEGGEGGAGGAAAGPSAIRSMRSAADIVGKALDAVAAEANGALDKVAAEAGGARAEVMRRLERVASSAAQTRRTAGGPGPGPSPGSGPGPAAGAVADEAGAAAAAAGEAGEAGDEALPPMSILWHRPPSNSRRWLAAAADAIAGAGSDSDDNDLPPLARAPRSRDARSRAVDDELGTDSSELDDEGESPARDHADSFDMVSRDDVSHC